MLAFVFRAEQALSTVAMRKFCEDKISSSLQPSQNRYNHILFLHFPEWLVLPGSWCSLYVCLSQVHQLFCWPSLGYNKDEQLTSVPASGLYSSFAKLPVRRRYNISFAWIHNLTNNTNRQTYMHSANALFQQSSFCQTFHNILGYALNMFNPLFHKEKGSADFVGAYQTCKYCTVLVIASSYIPLKFAGYAPFLKIYQSLQLVYSSRK